MRCTTTKATVNEYFFHFTTTGAKQALHNNSALGSDWHADYSAFWEKEEPHPFRFHFDFDFGAYTDKNTWSQEELEYSQNNVEVSSCQNEFE